MDWRAVAAVCVAGVAVLGGCSALSPSGEPGSPPGTPNGSAATGIAGQGTTVTAGTAPSATPTGTTPASPTTRATPGTETPGTGTSGAGTPRTETSGPATSTPRPVDAESIRYGPAKPPCPPRDDSVDAHWPLMYVETERIHGRPSRLTPETVAAALDRYGWESPTVLERKYEYVEWGDGRIDVSERYGSERYYHAAVGVHSRRNPTLVVVVHEDSVQVVEFVVGDC